VWNKYKSISNPSWVISVVRFDFDCTSYKGLAVLPSLHGAKSYSCCHLRLSSWLWTFQPLFWLEWGKKTGLTGGRPKCRKYTGFKWLFSLNLFLEKTPSGETTPFFQNWTYISSLRTYNYQFWGKQPMYSTDHYISNHSRCARSVL